MLGYSTPAPSQGVDDCTGLHGRAGNPGTLFGMTNQRIAAIETALCTLAERELRGADRVITAGAALTELRGLDVELTEAQHDRNRYRHAAETMASWAEQTARGELPLYTLDDLTIIRAFHGLPE